MNRRTHIIIAWSSLLVAAMLAWVAFSYSHVTLYLLAWQSKGIAYADFPAGTDGSHAYVKEIWKQPKGPEQLEIGTQISIGPPLGPHDARPDGVIIFFDDGCKSREFRNLCGSTRLYVNGGFADWEREQLSLPDTKAYCTFTRMHLTRR